MIKRLMPGPLDGPAKEQNTSIVQETLSQRTGQVMETDTAVVVIVNPPTAAKLRSVL